MIASHAYGVLIYEAVRACRLEPTHHAVLKQRGDLAVDGALARLFIAVQSLYNFIDCIMTVLVIDQKVQDPFFVIGHIRHSYTSIWE